MKKTVIALVLGGLLAVATAGVFLEPTGVVIGWVRGESFFQDRPTRYWRRNLKDQDPGARTNTIHTLSSADALRVLRELLKDRDADIRLSAVTALTLLKPDPTVAVPELANALSDDDRADTVWHGNLNSRTSADKY